MSVDARTRLADQQAALISALVSEGVAPDGFDAEHLQVATESLFRKRCRGVACTWPTLARALGDEFREQFAAYAEATPLPSHGGPLADGRGFAEWLRERGRFSEDAQLQTLAVDLRFARLRTGLHPRRMASIKLAWLARPRRLVIALRWPRLGERWFTIRLL
ncbi:MAG: hypothetical protein ACKV2Q_03035 [Planctomycetaceae bacterium]